MNNLAILVKSNQAVLIEKGGKQVFEYNLSKQTILDSARTVILPDIRYPKAGWTANGKVTMQYLCTFGNAKIEFQTGEVVELCVNDVITIPPMKWYFLTTGEEGFEAWMPCSPAWFKEQSLNKD